MKRWKPGQDNRQAAIAITENFTNQIVFNEHYDQIRFLDIKGIERIRVNRSPEGPHITPHRELQDKSNRYYFYEARNLNPKEIYISPLDLNKEHGRIQTPFKPTIRLTTPVLNGVNEPIGFLVINYLAETMLQEFVAQYTDRLGNITLLNDEGFWLYHHDPAMRWGFMFDNDLSLAKNLPDTWHQINSADYMQQITEHGMLTSLKTQPYLLNISQANPHVYEKVIYSSGYPWTVVSHIDMTELETVKAGILQPLLITGTPLFLITLITFHVIARHRTQAARQQNRITESELRNRSLLESVAEGIIMLDSNGRILEANPSAESMFGLTLHELQSCVILDLLTTSQDSIRLISRMQQLTQPTASEEIAQTDEYTAKRARNQEFPLQITLSRFSIGNDLHFTASLRDLTEQRLAYQEMMLASEVFDTASEGILVTDNRAIIQRVNPAFMRLTGYQPDELIGKKPSILRSYLTDNSFYRTMWQSIDNTGRWEGEINIRVKSGVDRIFDLSIFSIHDDKGNITHYASITRDITEEKKAEEQIHRHAYYDGLTGLPNRTLFLERLQQAINRGSRYHERFALFFIDLDRFKSVNDSLGHDAGDLLLQLVAGRISSLIRETDSLARHAGDEFSLLLHNIKCSDDLAVLAQKIINSLGKAFMIMNREVHIGASIGICEYPDDGREADILLRNADLAMYQAKYSGKETYRFFSEELNTAIQQHVRLEADLRIALNTEQFELYYQPLVDFKRCMIIGTEALIRWNHPEHGRISPDKFIPICEETGLIRPLSEWVIHHAAMQLAEWSKTDLAHMTISINLSAYRNRHAVDKGFIKETILETGAPTANMIFEITESLMMENTAESLEWLSFAKELGISVAVDDFGTGYSSLSYLKRFPVDIIKIDRSFIADMNVNGEDETLVMAIIAMARSLNMKVVAEGVENYQQLDMLRNKQDHCSITQGFLFAPPMPVDQFHEYYRNFDFNRYYQKLPNRFRKYSAS
ncbi:MAG: EAL domain-containing protein [Candidatus Thiodiazotropha sp.]